MSLFRDLQAEGEYVQPPSAMQSQSEPSPSPQPTEWGRKHLRERPRYGRPDPYHSTRKGPKQGPGPLRPRLERHARERECHGIYPTNRRRKGRQSIGSPPTSIPTSDTENAPLRSFLGTSTIEESNLGFFSHLRMGDDAQNMQASKPQSPSARSGHLYGSRDALVKQGGPKDAFGDGLDEKESGLEPRRSIAVEGEVVDGRKDAEDATAHGVQVKGIVHDNAAVGRDSRPDIVRVPGPGINSVVPLQNPTRRSQLLPIGLAASILCYSLAAGSWPASKLTLACAVVAITVKMWAARKGRKDRNKPTIVLDEALASNPRRADQ